MGTGVYSDHHLRVHPNPVTDELVVDCDLSISDLELINYLGQVIRKIQHPSGNKLTLHVSGLPEGIYLLTVKSGNSILTKKIIKQ